MATTVSVLLKLETNLAFNSHESPASCTKLVILFGPIGGLQCVWLHLPRFGPQFSIPQWKRKSGTV